MSTTKQQFVAVKAPSISRRGIMQAGVALLGAPLVLGGLSSLGFAAPAVPATPAAPATRAGSAQAKVNLPCITAKRRLGKGAYSMEVSALGFGVMGANYNRGVHPPKKELLYLMWREPEQELFPVLEELGIGFVPYSPLNRGFLGGDMTEYTRFDSGNDNRNTLPRFTPEALRTNLMYVELLNRFGRPRGMTGAQVALAWMLAKKDWIVPIPGTTKLSHLEENIRAADFVCTPQEWAELENALAQVNIAGARYPAEQQKQVQKH